MNRKKKAFLPLIAVIVLLVILAALGDRIFESNKNNPIKAESGMEIPAYSGNIFIELNNNKPLFTADEIVNESYENYSNLDALSRTGTAMACLSKNLMPTEDREYIGMIRPSGWVQNKYEGIVDSDPPYLYNRCHLIAFMLSGENANEKNLLTGTRYFNVEGMLPFEIKVSDYIRKTGNHVMYRVTPVYDGGDLLAKGVIMEAYSVEDKGTGIEFCVFVYNIQPGIDIDYSTGDNWVSK